MKKTILAVMLSVAALVASAASAADLKTLLASTHVAHRVDQIILVVDHNMRFWTKNGQGEAVVMDIASFERREQILRAQQMVLEAYIDQLAGAKSFSTDEVRSMMNRMIDGEQQ